MHWWLSMHFFIISWNSFLIKKSPAPLRNGALPFLLMPCFCWFCSDALKCVLSDFDDLRAIIPTKSLKLVREDVRGTKVNRRRFDFPPKQFRSPHHKETSSGKSSSAWLICMSRSLLISFWRSEMRSERF